jgi:hypothetical protein
MDDYPGMESNSPKKLLGCDNEETSKDCEPSQLSDLCVSDGDSWVLCTDISDHNILACRFDLSCLNGF